MPAPLGRANGRLRPTLAVPPCCATLAVPCCATLATTARASRASRASRVRCGPGTPAPAEGESNDLAANEAAAGPQDPTAA